MGFVKTVLDDLTYQVNGLAMQVQSELRPGHREKMYQRRLAELLTAAGLRNEMEKRVEVYVNDSLIGYMFLDLWVEDALVVECKAFSHQVDEMDVGQVVTYLAATGSPVGMLYNFGLRKLEYRRILPPKDVQEWHKYLYRCIWTPPGCSLPPIESITPETPIRFSVISQPWSPPIQTVNVPPIRSSDHPSPIRLSASRSNPLIYSSAGVNITAGNRAVELMRDAVRSTYDARVVAGIGAFGGMFDASALQTMRAPVLVASTDGVGTKVNVAAQARRYQSLGQDIVNHCVNDILVQGARPLFFLDYLASSQLEPEVVAEIVSGMAAACREARCVLLGGETAEMPGVYVPDAFDVAGTIVGIVERDEVLPRPGICAGDVLIGLRSSGPHTNGYSLIRKVFDDIPLDTVFSELGIPLADALLAPHRSYLPILQPALDHVKGLAHLTGGGFIENIPRVLPDGFGAMIRLGNWPVPPLFQLIQQRGSISREEMYRVFNMGIGMVAIVAPDQAQALQARIGEETFIIGELTSGKKQVTLV